MNTYNSAQFAELAGVAIKTLQRWDREGRPKPAARTPGNRRLYTPEQLNQVLNRVSKTKQVTVAYLRVSSQAQKPDLSNQKAALEQFCIARGMAVDEWISEIVWHVSGKNCWRIFARHMAARSWTSTQSRSVLSRQ